VSADLTKRYKMRPELLVICSLWHQAKTFRHLYWPVKIPRWGTSNYDKLSVIEFSIMLLNLMSCSARRRTQMKSSGSPKKLPQTNSALYIQELNVPLLVGCLLPLGVAAAGGLSGIDVRQFNLAMEVLYLIVHGGHHRLGVFLNFYHGTQCFELTRRASEVSPRFSTQRWMGGGSSP
jgi:hypothetical protein